MYIFWGFGVFGEQLVNYVNLLRSVTSCSQNPKTPLKIFKIFKKIITYYELSLCMHLNLCVAVPMTNYLTIKDHLSQTLITNELAPQLTLYS